MIALASNKLEPLKGFGRFTLNLKRFQKVRRVNALIFHKELRKVRGFFIGLIINIFTLKINFYKR
ncbi:hypothetical protein N871_02545 [Helicobacter pylori X47-2AL]|uniref:Uncharacterized protein n=1 Tax=Helicobacter pylori X47-2AL TaxID=1386083 RepID=V6LAV4_HELPX|nr:hypothetical protein N871_02545 [Helicobacter pylori X47-2AL]